MSDDMEMALDARINDICSRVDTLERVVLTGNGHPSLVSQISTLQAQTAMLLKLTWCVIGGVAAMVVKLWFV